jgi:hypothetical protein
MPDVTDKTVSCPRRAFAWRKDEEHSRRDDKRQDARLQEKLER